jgi:hypothetical protein
MHCAALPSRPPPSPIKGLGAVFVVTFAACVVTPVLAEQHDVSEGKKIWTTKAQCHECHGWAGDGQPNTLHSFGRAPSLRETRLSRDEIRMTIQCGRPGTPMPHFDRFAYTDKRCYDMTGEDLGDQVPDRGAVTLQTYEIDAVADYVAYKVKGAGPITRAECSEFFSGGADARCAQYPEK